MIGRSHSLLAGLVTQFLAQHGSFHTQRQPADTDFLFLGGMFPDAAGSLTECVSVVDEPAKLPAWAAQTSYSTRCSHLPRQI